MQELNLEVRCQSYERKFKSAPACSRFLQKLRNSGLEAE